MYYTATGATWGVTPQTVSQFAQPHYSTTQYSQQPQTTTLLTTASQPRSTVFPSNVVTTQPLHYEHQAHRTYRVGAPALQLGHLRQPFSSIKGAVSPSGSAGSYSYSAGRTHSGSAGSPKDAQQNFRNSPQGSEFQTKPKFNFPGMVPPFDPEKVVTITVEPTFCDAPPAAVAAAPIAASTPVVKAN